MSPHDNHGCRHAGFAARVVSVEFRDLTDSERSDLRGQLSDLAREFARRAADLVGESPCEPVVLSRADHRQLAELPQAERRDVYLARLHMLGIMQSELEAAAELDASSAAAEGANFRELGDAWGISRQAARKRWSQVRAVPGTGSVPAVTGPPSGVAGSGASREAESASPTVVWGQYQSRPGRRPLVAVSLADLRGPTRGTVEVPLRLFWSGPDRTFDLGDPADLRSLYEIVLGEAVHAEELAYLNGEKLAEVWRNLFLPKGVRRAWEEQHPALRAAAAA